MAAQIQKLREVDPEGIESDYESEREPISDNDSEGGGEYGGESDGKLPNWGSSWHCSASRPVAPFLPSLPAPTAPLSVQPATKKRKGSQLKIENDRDRKKTKRNEKRAINKTKSGLKQHVEQRIAQAAKGAFQVARSISEDCDVPITAPCWTVKKDNAHDQREYDKHKLCDDPSGPLMQHIEWDGRETKVLTDRDNRAFMVLGAHPKEAPPQSANWKNCVVDVATEAVESASRQMGFTPRASAHRRGRFPSVAVGVSHGGGQTRPSVLRQTKKRARVMGELLKLEPFQKMAGHADRLLQSYAPRLHQYYSNTNEGLESRDALLKRPFSNSIFAACSINFGPQTVAHKHRDYGNLTWGWCAITSLGSYDYRAGGHLVLWDLNVVIDFPPGSTILLPSALLCHSNTSIAPNETRYSFTQYSAGALFRWADNGFQPQEKWASQANEERLQQRQKDQDVRWQRGLGMLSFLDELKAATLQTMA